MTDERAPLPFEATMPPRRWMGAAALVGALAYVPLLVRFNLTESLASSHLAFTLLDLAFRAGLVVLLAANSYLAFSQGLGALAPWTLRITTARLEYVPPAWWSRWPGWGATFGMTIDAADVRRLAWDGYDNIGIELKSGQIIPMYFRNRIAKDQHAASRLAVLAFVSQASGNPLPTPPLDVAPWVVRDSSRVRS
ncbi:MAG: hypothetical protein FJ091_15635 [Deltaproteobacteria bacterium]|nr:hypothetical protein [Deltaproteobacteria bacterium]